MLAPLTISYSDDVQGWTSFWTYKPEFMVYVRNNFYTFKGGNLYLHNDESAPRTVYYPGSIHQTTPYCSVLNVFNTDPLDTKMYETIHIQSNIPWNTSIQTDLIGGQIDDSWYELKEGVWFSYIRRNSNLSGPLLTNMSQLDDQLSIKTVGIGSVLSATGAYIEFNSYPNQFLKITNTSYPDDLYIYNTSGVLTYVGTVSYVDNSTPNPKVYITYTSTPPSPIAGDNILAVKNSVAESYGARGYYMDVNMYHNSTSHVELFEISSLTFKSFM